MDSTVASVTRDGVVTASGDGVTRVWGVSGRDSAFAVVVVQAPVAPAVVTVLPNRPQFSALSAVVRLVVSNSDTLVRDSLPVCRSDDPRIAAVDSVILRTQGNGTTRIHCTIAGVEGVATVSVRQRIVRVRVVSDQEFAIRVGRDSLNLTLARVDSLRQPVERGVPRFVSLDTGVVRVDPVGGTVVALKLGTGRVVGSLEGFADTALIRVVEVAPPPTVSAVNVRRGGAAGSATRRPGVRVAGRTAPATRAGPAATQLGARNFQAGDSIFQAGTLTSTSFAHWAPTAFFSLVERRVDDGLGVDSTGRSTGKMGGAELEFTPLHWLRFHVIGSAGTIKRKNATGETGTVAEGQLDVGLALFSGLWIQVGGARRAATLSNVLGQWNSLRIGAESRFGLGKGSMQGVIRFTYFPYVTTPETVRPNVGLSSEAGVDFRRGAINGGLHYALERLDYPATPNGRRREQFGTLRLRLGLELGR